MKILIDARMIFMSGIGRVIRSVVPRLLRNHEISHIRLLIRPVDQHCVDAWIEDEKMGTKVTVSHLRSSLYSPFLGVADGMMQYCKGYDVAWFPHYPHPIIKKTPIPMVVTIPDCCHVAAHEARLPWMKRWLAYWFLSHARKNAPLAFYCNSAADQFHTLFGTPSCGEYRMPCGVDLSWYDVHVSSIFPKPYLVFVGNLKPHKNLGRLIETMHHLWDRGLEHDLIIIGKLDGFISGIKSPINILHHNEVRVKILGQLKESEMREIVAGATAMVFPSLYEGFGLPPLEAMAAGVPVICSAILPLQEVCGKAAIYFDPLSIDSMKETIWSTLQNPELLKRCAESGIEQSKLFSWDCCTAGLANALTFALNMKTYQ